MAKTIKPLAAIIVERLARGGAEGFTLARDEAAKRGLKPASGPVRLADGEGLYLLIEPSGSGRWLFLFRWRGKLKEMGLGSLAKVSLKTAREKAKDAREQLGQDLNPIQARRAAEAIPTFGEVADDLLAGLETGFRNPKHAATWRRAIGAPRPIRKRVKGKWVDGDPRPSFAHKLRPMRVNEITTNDVLGVLRPAWTTRHETASRLRGQIAQVLDAAKAKGFRTGENPAAWEGNLKHMLAARRKLTKGHRAALRYEELPKFMTALRAREAVSALALEFTILTAARAGEILGMRWCEVDLDGKLWIVPAARMKRSLEHRVPLPDEAVGILKKLALATRQVQTSFVFSDTGAKPMSEGAMMRLLERMEYRGITVHGFRSCFRDWAGDATSFPRDLAEQALSHAVGNEVELAYRRSDALERRRKMMQAWAGFCGGGAQLFKLARAG